MRCCEYVEKRIVELEGADPRILTCRLMDLLDEFKRGDSVAMRDVAAKGAGLAEGVGDFDSLAPTTSNRPIYDIFTPAVAQAREDEDQLQEEENPGGSERCIPR